MGKIKGDTTMDKSMNAEDKKSYSELLKNLNSISKPLASKKLTKRIYKCIKKASKQKNVQIGIKPVVKCLKKGEKGFVAFAGDIRPIEVMCHVPIMCEDAEVPYCYIPSKQDLGAAGGVKRPTCCMLVKTHSAYEDTFNECVAEIKNLPSPY